MRALSFISSQGPTARRLMLAVAGSIGIHAAALGMYGPAGTVGTSAAATPILHAVLAPSRPEPSEKAPGDIERQGGTERQHGDSDASGRLPAPDRWFRRSELDRIAAPIGGVQLDYPEITKSPRAAQVQVQVQVRLFIDERGIVRKITIEAPVPERAFEEAAIKAWHRVRFSPAMKDGAAVKSQQVIEVDFQAELALR